MSDKIKTIACTNIIWDQAQEGGKAILVSNKPCLEVGLNVHLKKRNSNRAVAGQVTEILESSSIAVKTFFWGWRKTKFTYIFQFKTIGA